MTLNQELIDRIKGRLGAEALRFPPVPEASVKEAEAALGFEIPPLLRLIYTEVSNGGFGPGYGIIGLPGGCASDLGTLVESYDEMRRGAEYFELEWPDGLLPFCEWGCNIFSCVDCRDARHPVYQSEPFERGREELPLGFGFEEFFVRWLDGLAVSARGHAKSVEIINPFTRQKTWVRGHGTERE